MCWLPVILMLPYFFLITGIYRNLLKLIPFRRVGAASSFISVVIACRNAHDSLPSLLDSLLQQDYPAELYEVIIVDDDPAHGTAAAIPSGGMPGNYRVVRNVGQGKKAAIRTGVETSAGRIILTTDADCTMGRAWIGTIAAFFENYSPQLVIGPVKLDRSRGFFGRFQELEFMSLQGITAGTAAGSDAIMCNGANLAFTRDAYMQHSENLHSGLNTGDDVFLLHSLKKEPGAAILWLESEEAMVTTAASPSLTAFLKQRRRWISKWNVYDDRMTILAGIIVLAAVLLQVYAYATLFMGSWCLLPAAAMLILKSIPDFLILLTVADRYRNGKLMRWFIPAQIVYPFYVISVILYGLLTGRKDQD